MQADILDFCSEKCINPVIPVLKEHPTVNKERLKNSPLSSAIPPSLWATVQKQIVGDETHTIHRCGGFSKSKRQARMDAKNTQKAGEGEQTENSSLVYVPRTSAGLAYRYLL